MRQTSILGYGGNLRGLIVHRRRTRGDRGFHETKDGRNTERTRLKKKGNAEKFEQSGFTYEYDHLQRRRLPTIVLSGHL